MATRDQPHFLGISAKWISLIVLTVQNSTLSILMHYSRTRAAPYSAAAAVLLNEIFKGSISIGVAFHNTKTQRSQITPMVSEPAFPSIATRAARLRREILSSDCWKLAVPAALYVLQNNLQYVAVSNLDVASFQDSYQGSYEFIALLTSTGKVLTTAVFARLMLRKRLNMAKWLSLGALAIGVGIVQVSMIDGKQAVYHGVAMDPIKGFSAVALACTTSGLAGVYFEMVLKGSTTDLWVRNVQLSLFSLPPALLPALAPGFDFTRPLSSFGRSGTDPYLFENFGGWVWSVIFMQVVGGLVTALVIKYSDNLMKGFASSLAIVLSSFAAIYLFSAPVSLGFFVGVAIVLGATWTYNRPAPSVGNSNYVPLSSSVSEEKNVDRRAHVSNGSASGAMLESLSSRPGTPQSMAGRTRSRQATNTSPTLSTAIQFDDVQPMGSGLNSRRQSDAHMRKDSLVDLAGLVGRKGGIGVE